MAQEYSVRDICTFIRKNYSDEPAKNAFEYLKKITEGANRIDDSGLKSAVDILAETYPALCNLGRYDFNKVITDLKRSRRNIRLTVGFTIIAILTSILAYRSCAKPQEQEPTIEQQAEQYVRGVIDERVQHTEKGIQVDLDDSSEFYGKLIKFKKAYNNLSSEEKELMKKKAGAIAELYASPEPENKEKAKQGLDDLLVELEKKGIKLE
ncbi:hypothetical protein J4209_02230 [Candidatus Woesearchaeota archaeon]|nr:hypothetical protein [Candidatus Woesearchaeota archaeon]